MKLSDLTGAEPMQGLASILLAEYSGAADGQEIYSLIKNYLYMRRGEGVLEIPVQNLIDLAREGDPEGMGSLLSKMPDIVKDVENGIIHLKDGGYDDPEPPPPPPEPEAEKPETDDGPPPESAEEPEPPEKKKVDTADTLGNMANSVNPLT